MIIAMPTHYVQQQSVLVPKFSKTKCRVLETHQHQTIIDR